MTALFRLTALLVFATFASTGPQPKAACSAGEYHQFDFFAGDWDAYDIAAPTKIVARNHVTQMLNGCALREVYEQNDGLRGESFSAYDAARGVWHQSWVTNRGQILLLDGTLENGRMVLSGKDDKGAIIRGTWIPQRGAVRETAERSTDGGKTWMPVFDMVFRPHR
jgi:hypothetical protein